MESKFTAYQRVPSTLDEHELTNQLHVAWTAAKIYSCPFPSALSCICPTYECLVPFAEHSVPHSQLCFEGLQAKEKQT